MAFNVLTNGGPEMAQFSMSIYPNPMRLLFTFLGKSSVAAPVFGWIGPAGGLAFLAVSLLVFRAVERSYVSTGS